MTPEEMVDLYRQLKEKLSEVEARQKNEVAPVKAAMAKLEGSIDKFMADNDLVNIKTKYGTAYFKTRFSASLTDPEAFMEFVKANGRFDLLDRKGNVTSIRDYAKVNKTLPPGAKLDSRRSVHIVKAGASIPEDEE